MGGFDILRYLFISFGAFFPFGGAWKGGYEIVIKRHAFERAMQRRIHPHLIEETLQSGRMRRFGRNRVKFEKEFREFTIACVDEIAGNTIRIVTITRKWK